MNISRRTLLRAATAGATVAATGSVAATASAGTVPSSTVPGGDVRVSFDAFASHAEPCLAANPLDPAVLLGACMVGDVDDPHLIATYSSADNGRTWSAGGTLPLPPGTAEADDVTVVFDGGGRGFVSAMATSGLARDDRGTYVWRTDDGGRTFQAPVPAATGTFVDHPGMAADPSGSGALHLAWVAEDHAGLGYTRSTDGGATFEPVRLIQGTDRLVSGTMVAAGPDGLVAAIYGATPDPAVPGTMFVHVAASTDDGATFAAPVRLGSTNSAIALPGGVIANGSPTLAFDPTTGALYAAFATHQPGSDHSDIAVTVSFDGGATWSAPAPATPDDHTVYFQPRLAVDHRGRVGLLAFALTAGRVTPVLLVSPPGLPCFDAPTPVAATPFDPTIGYDGNPKHGAWWIGDYQGLAATPNGFHALWNDTRTGRLDLFSALAR